MATSTKWIIAILASFALLAIVFGLGLVSLIAVRSDDRGGSPEPVPVVEEAPADGEWFGLVSVGRDESGQVTLGIDLAQMLTGQAAHDAAVEDGVITADEDLPNDFYIHNPDSVLELMYLSSDATITVISADAVETSLEVDAEELAALFDGTYLGASVYGIAPGVPIAMDLVVEGGEVTTATAIYLP